MAFGSYMEHHQNSILTILLLYYPEGTMDFVGEVRPPDTSPLYKMLFTVSQVDMW